MSRTWDPDATVVPDEASAQAGRDAGLLVGRYELGPLIGRGGSGQVHRAHDRLTGTDVAVKFVRALSDGGARQLRRELTALRLLDLPGVVHLLDDGEDEGQTFLVMDLLPGGRFDSLGERGGWDAWRDEALAMLEALARVHFAGVVHRDLKPANILLDAGGRPVLTDFGLAQGDAVEDAGERWREGTPRYMAPEQMRGEACDARTDLYAVGVMLGEMLEGGDVPEPVAAAVAAMRAERPADRPASAVEVLQALGAGTTAILGSVAALPDVAGLDALQALFDEPEVSFLHLAEDAAAVLHARTGGRRAEVQAELEGWVRAGRCHWVEGRIAITRTAIEALQWEDDPGRAALAAALAAGEDDAEAQALERALAAHAVGASGRGLAILDAIAAPGEGPVAVAVVDLALSLQRTEQLKRAIYLAQRYGWPTCLALLQAALEALHGDPARGLDALTDLAELSDGTLEGWRLALAVFGATHTSPETVATWLARATQWAHDDEGRQARVATWEGRAAYASGDFGRALAHERVALAGARTAAQRLARLTTAAAAALEVPDLALADELASEAQTLAGELRHPLAEARATWLLHSAAYRAGRPYPPQPQVIAAADTVSPGIAAQLALTHAAAAWRLGDRQLAADLAARAATRFQRLKFADGAVLARALRVICGGDDVPTAEELQPCHPRIAVQVAALCALAGRPIHDARAPWDADTLRGAVMDVLTGEECLRALLEV